MKNHKRTLAALVLAVMCVLLVSSACAASSTKNLRNLASTRNLDDLPPFKFEKHKYGIGYGSCPVYTAPSEAAFRRLRSGRCRLGRRLAAGAL